MKEKKKTFTEIRLLSFSGAFGFRRPPGVQNFSRIMISVLDPHQDKICLVLSVKD